MKCGLDIDGLPYMGKGEGRLADAMTLYSGKHEIRSFTAHVYGHPSNSPRPHLG